MYSCQLILTSFFMCGTDLRRSPHGFPNISMIYYQVYHYAMHSMQYRVRPHITGQDKKLLPSICSTTQINNIILRKSLKLHKDWFHIQGFWQFLTQIDFTQNHSDCLWFLKRDRFGVKGIPFLEFLRKGFVKSLQLHQSIYGGFSRLLEVGSHDKSQVHWFCLLAERRVLILKGWV